MELTESTEPHTIPGYGYRLNSILRKSCRNIPHELCQLKTQFVFSYTQTVVNQTLVEKYGTHEASFYQLINDPVKNRFIPQKL